MLLVGKPEGKRQLGRSVRSGVEIKMDLGGIGWDSMGWIDLANGRNQWRSLVNTVNKPSGLVQCWEILQ
jgi:hypothetical protein